MMMGIAEEYAAGKTTSVLMKEYACSFKKLRKEIVGGGVLMRARGQKYIVPDKEKFKKDCEEFRWSDLEKKYGVSWSIIKGWKKRLELTTGKKEDRKVVYGIINGCWICTSHKAGKEYPRCRKGELVVRRLWREKNGQWPVGKLVRHLCNHKWCVNPDHVVPGTQFENLVDVVLDGSGVCGKREISLLTNAFRRGVISIGFGGRVIRNVDGKIFNISGNVEITIVEKYSGSFERLREIKINERMNEGGGSIGI
jgi:hypothetical protein